MHSAAVVGIDLVGPKPGSVCKLSGAGQCTSYEYTGRGEQGKVMFNMVQLCRCVDRNRYDSCLRCLGVDEWRV